jgi:hypothetical protein
VSVGSLSGIIALGTGATATQNYQLVIGSGAPPLSGILNGNLQLYDIKLTQAQVITPVSTVDDGKFLILNINGVNKPIRLWNYTT